MRSSSSSFNSCIGRQHLCLLGDGINYLNDCRDAITAHLYFLHGLGDIIKNEISVSFGKDEDNKAASYVDLAKSQGLEPARKMKVEPMTLKALVRERIEAGKDMPTEIFGVYTENKTTIKRKQ